MNSQKTIAALATAPAPAGVGIIRISGDGVKDALDRVFHSERSPVESPRTLTYGKIVSGEKVIDHGLAVYMPGPNSYTGEDVAELQIHGSPFLAQKVLQALYSSDVVPAEAGEFTKRAFLNGKIDLLQAESIADMIAATSESALRVAGHQLEGKLTQYIDEIAEPLRDLLAEIEASLDFPEEDIEPSKFDELMTSLDTISSNIATLYESYNYGQKVKDGYKVLLCGPPNAGKSSLLNLLLGKERAIVTDISGTTRDLIEEECVISDYRFILCDSAGITESEDTVERIGIELSIDRLSWADLVLLVVDASSDMEALTPLVALVKEKTENFWVLFNKTDLLKEGVQEDLPYRNYPLSVKNEEGVNHLREALKGEIEKNTQSFSENSAVITHVRHQELVGEAARALESGRANLQNKAPLELVSEEFRVALKALEEMVGKTYSDDILGRIFTKFCIGK